MNPTRDLRMATQAILRETPEDRLCAVLEAFQRWLLMPDTGAVTIALGTVAANQLDGKAVWLLLVGPPSSGKTEILDSLLSLPNVHSASVLTEAALLSGSGRKDRTKDSTGGLLRKIGAFGYLVMKDFTSVLSMHTEQRNAVLAALREVFDGAWTRWLGTDGGQTLPWTGKCAFLGGVTPILDQHHGVIAGMGERFLLSRMPRLDAEKQARRALHHLGHEREMQRALRDAVRRIFDHLEITPLELHEDDIQRLSALATLAAECRSSVERDSRNREIELVPDPELPARLTQALARLYHGMRLIGTPPEEAWRLIQKVALDSMPATRLRVLGVLLKTHAPVSTPDLATKIGYPTTTARRICQDLAAHSILLLTKDKNNHDFWEISPAALDRWDRAGLPPQWPPSNRVPEKPETP
jgi:hypothetical protein